MSIGNLYIFFGEMSIWVFCPFFDWDVCFFVVELFELFVKWTILISNSVCSEEGHVTQLSVK